MREHEGVKRANHRISDGWLRIEPGHQARHTMGKPITGDHNKLARKKGEQRHSRFILLG